jgi:carbon storage regulator
MCGCVEANLIYCTRRLIMLVLSRREQERIRLGDSIVVTILRVSGERVRIGIEAPPEVAVVRDELPPYQNQVIHLAPTGS